MNGQSRKHQWKLRCHEPTLWRPSESGTVSATRNPLCIRLMFEKRPIQRTTDDFVSDLVSIGTERERGGRFCVCIAFFSSSTPNFNPCHLSPPTLRVGRARERPPFWSNDDHSNSL